ncbi:MAG: ribosome maturation factor RimP [Acidobacteria bacterium]|nr:MAG: ribosome maturation factor RimP [Acidobacteriota bacterium]
MISSKTQELEVKLEKILLEEHVELVCLEFKKQGKSWLLRVFIDTPDGVTLDDCERVSRRISDYLDEADPIEQAFSLEVSSPGIDRPLVKPKHFERFTGERIQIKLYRATNGKKAITGKLVEFQGDQLTIMDESDKQIHNLELGQISKATLKPILTF